MLNKHLTLFSLILGLFLFTGGTNDSFAVSAGKKSGLLEEEKPTLLPTNPVYFIKDFWRGTRLLFVPDPVKKAELELRFMEEKLTEARRLAELTDNERAIEKALRIYQSAQMKLKDRVSELKKMDNNLDVEKLFEKIAGEAVQHERVLGEIFEKLEQLARDEGVKISLSDQRRLQELREDIETMLFLFSKLEEDL